MVGRFWVFLTVELVGCDSGDQHAHILDHFVVIVGGE